MKRSMLALFTLLLIGGVIISAFEFLPFYSQTNDVNLLHVAILVPALILLCMAALVLGFFSIKKLSRMQVSRAQIQTHLNEQRKLFDTTFDNATYSIALINLDGRLLRVNKAFCELLGYTEIDMLALNFYYLISASDLNALQIHIQQLIDKKLKLYQCEQQCYCKNGETVWVMTTISLIRDQHDQPLYFLAQIQNITMQKKAEERLRHMAYHDPLTGLANRNKLEQFITHILASSRRHQQGFAVVFLDLDRFKNINDTLGHEAGDILLQIIGERLRNTVRNTDMVARLGGDEFVLLITDVKKTESVAIIAQKILESVLQVVVVKGQEIYITTSIGISLYPYDGQNLQSLMKNADLSLYRAKEHGRNNYQFYTAEMTARAQEKMALQNALAHALIKNEFILHYQPKMDIITRRITGIEELLRWKNKDFGTITPDAIVALAEETGLIIPVSDWVVRTACKQLKVWHEMGLTSLTMAINCTERQIKQVTFVDDILRIITENRLPAQSIEIEVTESTIMQDPENILRVLYALKDIGVQIAIDDFGTGYWSLSNLRRLSVDKIKIDKTFIKQVTVDEASAAITSAIIAMVNKLGIKSIAEGVETREQFEFLAKEGCTEIQGYYLKPPLSEELMTTFLKHPMPDAEVITNTETSQR